MMIVQLAFLALISASPALAAASPAPSNPEMAAIFKADQADRSVSPIDWKIVGAADEKRRARTEQLLDDGSLKTGEDFYDAAFVFQHGHAANDYLKAHLLAMVAIARGQPGAPWIAAATLDRYLNEIGKPQVLGTQFTRAGGGKFTQEPYDRALASDAMREALQVPPLAEQETERKAYEARAAGAAKNAK